MTDTRWTALDWLRRGQDALDRAAWEEARAAFLSATGDAPSAEGFEGLSWAAWWLNDSQTLFRAREQSYRLYQGRGDARGAARIATWIASDYVDFRGELPIAAGWRMKAKRLLEGLPTTPEHGWLALVEGDTALLAEDDTDRAMECARVMEDAGRQLSVPDLALMGLALEGLARVTQGEVHEGLSLIDEAGASALSGDLTELFSASWALCYLIYACERVRDFARASLWCQRLKEYADRIQLRPAQGICRAHYAGVLISSGRWAEAEAELAEADEHIVASGRLPLAAESAVRLGELRLRQGRLQEAAAIFEQLSWHPKALLGQAEVGIRLNRLDEAQEYLDRLLRQLPAQGRLQQIAALELLTRVQALRGDHERATETWARLAELSSLAPTESIRAGTHFAAGFVAVASEHFDDARRRFEDAIDGYQRADAPYEAAGARLELARLLRRLGRQDRAQAEAQRAAEAFRELGATLDEAEAMGLGQEVEGAVSEGAPLTSRQIEILRLVAEGCSDKEVASRLVVSEHTVHRHVANILTRLGLPSRSAAVAYAARHGLLS